MTQAGLASELIDANRNKESRQKCIVSLKGIIIHYKQGCIDLDQIIAAALIYRGL